MVSSKFTANKPVWAYVTAALKMQREMNKVLALWQWPYITCQFPFGKEICSLCFSSNRLSLKQSLLPSSGIFISLLFEMVYLCNLSRLKCFYDPVGRLGHTNHSLFSSTKLIVFWHLFSPSYLHGTLWFLTNLDIIKQWRGGPHLGLSLTVGDG